MEKYKRLPPFTDNYADKVQPYKKDFARKMRKNPTIAESILWQAIRKHQIGLKFTRQRVILGYIVDFYCPAYRLVIECDGPIHDTIPKNDRFRDLVLSKKGFTTLRFYNEQIETNLEEVINAIKERVYGS